MGAVYARWIVWTMSVNHTYIQMQSTLKTNFKSIIIPLKKHFHWKVFVFDIRGEIFDHFIKNKILQLSKKKITQ